MLSANAQIGRLFVGPGFCLRGDSFSTFGKARSSALRFAGPPASPTLPCRKCPRMEDLMIALYDHAPQLRADCRAAISSTPGAFEAEFAAAVTQRAALGPGIRLNP